MKGYIALILIIVIGFIGVVGISIYSSFNDHTCTIEVTDKERVHDGDSSKYLIYGRSDDGDVLVFENTDCLLRGKFNSSNVYAGIEVGTIYEMTVVGWRIPIFSSYENIIKFKEIATTEG